MDNELINPRGDSLTSREDDLTSFYNECEDVSVKGAR